MNNRIKSVVLFIGILFLWLLGELLFKLDVPFYDSLVLPNFIMSPEFMSISWFIIFLLVTISVFIVIRTTNIFRRSDYLYVLTTNYLASQLYPFMFYTLQSPFFGFIMSAIVFISSIFLYIETRLINKRASYLLIPYIVFSTYSLIVALAIYIMNF